MWKCYIELSVSNFEQMFFEKLVLVLRTILFVFYYNINFYKKEENFCVRSVLNLDVSNYEQIFYYG